MRRAWPLSSHSEGGVETSAGSLETAPAPRAGPAEGQFPFIRRRRVLSDCVSSTLLQGAADFHKQPASRPARKFTEPPGEAQRHSSAPGRPPPLAAEPTLEPEKCSHLIPAGSVTGEGRGEAAGRSQPHLLREAQGQC